MGCGGNKNNFLSYSACEKVCQKNVLQNLIESFSTEYIAKRKVSIFCMYLIKKKKIFLILFSLLSRIY